MSKISVYLAVSNSYWDFEQQFEIGRINFIFFSFYVRIRITYTVYVMDMSLSVSTIRAQPDTSIFIWKSITSGNESLCY